MMTFTRDSMTLPLAYVRAARAISAQPFDAGLFNGRFGSRLALYKGGFLTPIPPVGSPGINNHTSCQSPGRGRPH
jgi:hypothetical protein